MSSSPVSKNSVFKRMFSTESSTSTSSGRFSYNLYPHPDYTYGLCGKEVLLKLGQVVICLICTGLFSYNFCVTEHNSTTIFPITVYVSFFIISGIICLGYVLGHVMHELLQRAFNAIGATLFFICSCLTFQLCFVKSKYEGNDRFMSHNSKIMFAQATLSGINCVLYALDVGLSIKKSLDVTIVESP